MVDLRISANWMPTTSGEPEIKATAAQVGLFVDDISLTRHQDVWTKTERDSVFVSAYPLAMWFASSWWRLHHEPQPKGQPNLDWRMSHELGAANHGFVWPRIIFIPDGEVIHVWAEASMTSGQSVNYLSSLNEPKRIALNDFQQRVRQFIHGVIDRLAAMEVTDSHLANLWAVLLEDLADPAAARRRKLEAQLGFDPEECPEQALDAALQWEKQLGSVALSELAPAMSAAGATPDLAALEQLAHADGVMGRPIMAPGSMDRLAHGAPWVRATHDARALRRKIGNIGDPIRNRDLHDLLGLREDDFANWTLTKDKSPVAVAIPMKDHSLKFVPRKASPAGQRFELARFLGEYLCHATHEPRWLASTDLSTSHQKYQRAFAAEFLCPIDALTSFLDGDFSTSAIKHAAAKFDVSERAVTNLLQSNGCIPVPLTERMPYSINV